jgi:hypothetical protein
MLKPLTGDTGKFGFKREPDPDNTVHTAVPAVGIAAFKVVAEEQTVCLRPASGSEGNASLVTVTVLDEERQTPLEIVHTKSVLPLLNPKTAEDGSLILTIVGGKSLVIVTVLEEDGQVPFEMVHTKSLGPLLKPLTVVEDALELVTEPVPLITDQIPIPVVGVFAVNVVEEAQMV